MSPCSALIQVRNLESCKFMKRRGRVEILLDEIPDLNTGQY